MAGSLLAIVLVEHYRVELPVLFYVSWAFSTAGLAVFAGLVQRPAGAERDSLDSIVAIFRRYGLPGAAAAVRALYRSAAARWWSVWWVLGYSQYFIFSNYYQNLFSNIDRNGSFGTAEVLIEGMAALGSAASIILGKTTTSTDAPATEARFAPWIITAGSTMISGGLFAVVAAQSIYPAFVITAVVFGFYALLFAAGSNAIARGPRDPRHAVVFTANTTAALALAAVELSVCGAAGITTTHGYVRVMAAEQAVLSAVILTLGIGLWLKRYTDVGAAAQQPQCDSTADSTEVCPPKVVYTSGAPFCDTSHFICSKIQITVDLGIWYEFPLIRFETESGSPNTKKLVLNLSLGTKVLLRTSSRCQSYEDEDGLLSIN